MNFKPNGMRTVDRLLREHGLIASDETWVHGMWTPDKWWRCLKAKLCGRKLVRMTHGSLSPVYLEQQGKWRKRLVAPIERFLFRICDRVVVTGPWERTWCEQWGVKGPFQVVDLKAFFNIGEGEAGTPPQRRCGVPSPQRRCGVPPHHGELHILYLGRRHPLKGIQYLEQAVRELNESSHRKDHSSAVQPSTFDLQPPFALRLVTDHTGEELERDWAWCDILCLPSLSENFGLVVAEALARGKRVIATDGAPAWEKDDLVYIRGFREASDSRRVELLKAALAGVAPNGVVL